jgi:hypothetical protein
MGKIEKNCKKMRKIVKNWEKLGKIEKNGKNCKNYLK